MAPTRAYATDAVWLNLARGRFGLPLEILRSAGWANASEDESLMAEVITLGHIRLHRRSSAEAIRQKEDERAAQEFTDERALETFRQALADRFHDIKFSRTDNKRVVLRPELVLAIVGDACREERVRLFVQAGNSTVDVMTNAIRMSRLRANTD